MAGIEVNGAMPTRRNFFDFFTDGLTGRRKVVHPDGAIGHAVTTTNGDLIVLRPSNTGQGKPMSAFTKAALVTGGLAMVGGAAAAGVVGTEAFRNQQMQAEQTGAKNATQSELAVQQTANQFSMGAAQAAAANKTAAAGANYADRLALGGYVPPGGLLA